jgi:hypothetical protein
VLAFWSGIYVLHEQVTAISVAERKARERERLEQEREAALQRIVGRWVSVHEDGRISFREDGVVLKVEPKAVVYGSWRFENGVYLLMGLGSDEDCRARITGDELGIECFRQNVMSWVVAERFRRPKG